MNISLLSGPQETNQLLGYINTLILSINAQLSGTTETTLTVAYSGASATPGTKRSIYGISNIGAGLTQTSGNLVGVRGEVNMPSGTTVGGGVYLYGVQGKFIGGGTMNHADSRICGMLAQLDISAGTYTTGQLSGLWVDMGPSASASAVSTQGGGQCNIIRAQNTTAMVTNAILYGYGDSDYAFDFSAPGGTSDYFALTGTVVDDDGYLKVLVGGSIRYIGLGATVA